MDTRRVTGRVILAEWLAAWRVERLAESCVGADAVLGGGCVSRVSVKGLLKRHETPHPLRDALWGPPLGPKYQAIPVR